MSHSRNEFFDSLYLSQEFCETMGRVTLASSRFESDLRRYLALRGVTISQQAALGKLIESLERNRMLSENGVQLLRHLKRQRNYLTHSLYDLLSGRIEESMLPRRDIVLSDVLTYADKARELEENLVSLTKIVENAIEMLENSAGEATTEALLFRP